MKAKIRPINLALQGGGAHGAFTWGVLDALLEDGRFKFDGISATSSGAMNAVVLAHGLRERGAEGARSALADFWHAVADNMPYPIKGNGAGQSSSFSMFRIWTDYFSPEQLNPLSLDPLREIITRQIDFESLRRHAPVKLFLAATNVNSGKLRLFREHELSPDALMASACLPTIQRAVEIDGESYWDGGFAANPAVFPLLFDCSARDIVLVLLSPLTFEKTPESMEEIKNRIQELAFNATFLREMRLFTRLLDHGRHSLFPLVSFERRLQHTYFHAIEMGSLISVANPIFTTNATYFEMLRDSGRLLSRYWMSTNCDDIGRHSTINISKLFC